MLAKPPSLIDREVLNNENYLFVSYAHKDSETIFPILADIFTKGVNYWYDKELDVGDVWHEIAGEYLVNEHCRGAIVFLSKESAASDAVYREVQTINSICKERSFRKILVLLDSDDILDLCGSTMKLKKDSANIKKKIDAIYDLSEDENCIYWVNAKTEDTCKMLVEQSQKTDTNTHNTVIINQTDIEALLKSSHKLWLEGASYYITVGKYQWDSENNFEPITWKLVGQDECRYIFVTRYAIDCAEYTRLAEIERTVFDQVNAYPYITKIYTMDTEFCKKYGETAGKNIMTDYADLKRAQYLRAFWVKSLDAASVSYLICNSAGKVLNTSIIPDNINCGVRLVMIIDSSKAKE